MVKKKVMLDTCIDQHDVVNIKAGLNMVHRTSGGEYISHLQFVTREAPYSKF